MIMTTLQSVLCVSHGHILYLALDRQHVVYPILLIEFHEILYRASKHWTDLILVPTYVLGLLLYVSEPRIEVLPPGTEPPSSTLHPHQFPPRSTYFLH
jgi:hypothetical protein